MNMMKLGLYTADDFQIVKLALALRVTSVVCCQRCLLDTKRMKQNEAGSEDMQMMNCILTREPRYIGNVVQSYDGEVAVIHDGARVTPSIVLSSVRHIRDMMLEMKTKKFWPVSLANSFVSRIGSVKAVRERMLDDISCSNCSRGGVWRSFFHKLNYDFIKGHPITLEKVESCIEKLKKKRPSIEGKADPFITEQRETLCKRLFECTRLTDETMHAAVEAYEYDEARKRALLSAMSEHSILFRERES